MWTWILPAVFGFYTAQIGHTIDTKEFWILLIILCAHGVAQRYEGMKH